MPEEMIDIVDEAHEPLGVASKKLAHRLGLWHYSIHCWIYRQDPVSGDTYLLFQKRSSDKDLFPNCLDISAAGHYQTGESPDDGVREISEELGLEVAVSQLVYLGVRTEVAKIGAVLNREFCRVYLLRTNLKPSEISPSIDEVDGLVEIDVSDGLALCAGERTSVRGVGIEGKDGVWSDYAGDITMDLFIPRKDPYYYKMFMLARLAASGEHYLAV
jgi:isopentenyldiphosphate isomerase